MIIIIIIITINIIVIFKFLTLTTYITILQHNSNIHFIGLWRFLLSVSEHCSLRTISLTLYFSFP